MVIGKRLRQIRIAQGMSLDALASAMGNLVTKQSLSKYERGASNPSEVVLVKMAETLDVSITSLTHMPMLDVETIEYRKRSSLRKHEEHQIENMSCYALEKRICLLDKLGKFDLDDAIIEPIPVKSIEESETAAKQLRERWNLGSNPIPSMVDLLENKRIHVIEIDAPDGFDGLSLKVVNNKETPVSYGVVTRRGISGERQRLNLAHELGHIVLELEGDVDPEKAAFRFGAAFLVPKESLIQDVGRYRNFISLQEMLVLKSRYKMSIQALLYRLHELGIINTNTYRRWFILLGKKGWRKEEPQKIEPERLEWINLIVYGAILKGLLSEQDAKQLLCLNHNDNANFRLKEILQFVNRSETERHELLTRQFEYTQIE
ncbi:MAG: XRE family transcriptional regulator [Bacteroidetes bacterium]|nr:XRE family transcriptional regulator [Bacteroidota bacterium]